MRLAVMSDIHSNDPALSACLEDARAAGAEGYVFLGDYISDLAYPRRSLERLYALQEEAPCWFLRGNREDYMLRAWKEGRRFRPGSKEGSLGYTFGQLQEKDLRFFDALPIYRKIFVDGVWLEAAHAERSTNAHVFEEEDPYLETVFGDMNTKLLLTGHSHRQYIRRKGGRTILNPGALGIPQGKPGYAQYALADVCPGELSAQLRAVPYDVPRVIREQYESGLAAQAGLWAVSILNNIVTGENPMLELLRRVEASDGAYSEAIWHREAEAMGLAMTPEALLRRWEAMEQ